MSVWNGTQWIEDTPAVAAQSPNRNWPATIGMLLILGALLLPFQATMAAPHNSSAGPCEVSVSSPAVGETFWLGTSGLPTGIAINLWTTDADGTTGSPLGSTTDGTFDFQVAAAVAGTTTYKFAGPTKKNNTTVYPPSTVEAP
jgi:hypothetical protein